MLFFLKRCSSKSDKPRHEERKLVNPNERRVTPDCRIWGAALRDGFFLRSAALFLTDVQLAHCARNALLNAKKASPLQEKIALTGLCMENQLGL